MIMKICRIAVMVLMPAAILASAPAKAEQSPIMKLSELKCYERGHRLLSSYTTALMNINFGTSSAYLFGDEVNCIRRTNRRFALEIDEGSSAKAIISMDGKITTYGGYPKLAAKLAYGALLWFDAAYEIRDASDDLVGLPRFSDLH